MDKLDEYLSLLNPEQLAAVEHEGNPLLILAGAGSGKTRVITTKIAYLISRKGIDPRSILAVTFTKKAAKEMQQRAVSLDERASLSQIRTFHSFGSWFLRRYYEEAGIDKNFTVYDDDDMVTLVQKAVPDIKKADASQMAHYISLAKDYCLTPDDDLSEITSEPEFASIYRAYQSRLRTTGNVDFGDLIMLPVLVLKENQNVRRQMHYRFQVIMIDEYQDSNVAQFMMLKALSGVEEGSGTYVCVVGDDDQSIYKFRGAEVKNILSFEKEFPGTTLIRLERNYRSVSEILNAADCVVSNNQDRLGKTLIAERGNGKKPDLVFLPTQDDEARFCAELIEKSHAKGVPYQDWAILYRMNAQSLLFESEFLHRNIPYTIVGSLKFYEREEIKDMLAYISLVANPRDEIAFRRVVNKPARGVGNSSQEKIINECIESGGENILTIAESFSEKLPKKARAGVNDFCALIKRFRDSLSSPESSMESSPEEARDLSEFVEMIMNESGLFEYHQAEDEIAGTQRAANMQELVNSAVVYSFSMEGLLEFLDHIELDRTLETGDDDDPDKVTLITLHNTKGLEFERVVITGVENGIFPRLDKAGADLEEERRLFYVGITRAKNELYITSCAQRRMYGRNEFMMPSRFLMEAGAEAFRVLGKAPRSYQNGLGGFGSSSKINSEDSMQDTGDAELAGLNANHPLAKKWAVGEKVFHDDYGYGQIIASKIKEGEFVITVMFNGRKMHFMPEYQSGSLFVVKDE